MANESVALTTYSDSYSSQTDINSPEFNSSGKNKRKAISNASQALQIAQKLKFNDMERDIRRARVLAAFNGAAPYCEGDLRNKAQSYRYNVSFGFLEGVVGRAIVPYNDLTVNIADLTEIQANLSDAKKKIIQSELSKILQKWGRWPKFITRLNQDLVLNGYDVALFPSDYDPFPVFVSQKHGFVDDGSPNDVNDLEIFIWEKSYLLHELYAKIEDANIAKKAGWNVDNTREALTSAAPKSLYTNNMTSSGMWTAVESAIRGGSLWSSVVGAKMVDTFHVFAAELGGKVTHYIVLNDQVIDKVNTQDKYTNVDGPELFKKEERFESMRDFLVYFDLETGDGTWHGSRGVGQRAFNTHVAIDKLRCSMLDQAFVSGLTMLQPQDQTSQEEFTLTVCGPYAIIPPGITINPVVLPAVSNTTFQADALLSATSEQRIGDVVPQAQLFNQVQETATAARIKAGRAELITKGNLKRYIDPISELMSIMVRRLLKKDSPNAYAKEFQKELKRKGLTDDDLKEIRGARNTGKIEDILGNTAANTQLVFAEFRGDPDVDQLDLKYRRISSVLDADAADELLIPKNDMTQEIEGERQQEIELTPLLNGLKVNVSPRDNHEAHLKWGFGWFGEMVQAQAQQFDPAVVPQLKLVLPHLALHVEALSHDKNKKAAFKEYDEKLKLSANAIKDLEKQGLQLAKGAIDSAAKLAKTPEEFQQIQQAQQTIKNQQSK